MQRVCEESPPTHEPAALRLEWDLTAAGRLYAPGALHKRSGRDRNGLIGGEISDSILSRDVSRYSISVAFPGRCIAVLYRQAKITVMIGPAYGV